MTRAQRPDGELDYRTFCAPAAPRLVLLLRTGAVATADPNPSVTSRYDVVVVAVQLDGEELHDPPAFGGETPAESTTASLLQLIARERPDGAVGVVGERETSPIAAALAERAAGRVDRLALVAAPIPGGPLDRDVAGAALSRVAASTALFAAPDDPVAPAADAQWYVAHLPSATLTTAEPSDPALDKRLSLTDVWEQVLPHVAPGCERR